MEVVSIDQLKPAHQDLDQPVQVAPPRHRDRPISTLPPVNAQQAQRTRAGRQIQNSYLNLVQNGQAKRTVAIPGGFHDFPIKL